MCFQESVLAVFFTPASFGLDGPDDAGFARKAGSQPKPVASQHQVRSPLAGLTSGLLLCCLPRRISALDVPDDAGFARNSPGRSLTLGPGLSSGPPGPIAGRALRATNRVAALPSTDP